MDFSFEPLDRWPLPDTKDRSPILFKSGYASTLHLLSVELEFLGVTGRPVIQVVTRNGAADLRRDGMLTARAKVDHPGVRLSFQSKHGPLTYSTDQYEGQYYGQMPDWQANLRAVALGLGALRSVDRYGISKSGEQYRGWVALEAGPAKLTEEQALEVLRANAPESKADEPLPRLHRWAMAGAHPDRHGGDRGAWDDVERAAKTLGLM